MRSMRIECALPRSGFKPVRMRFDFLCSVNTPYDSYFLILQWTYRDSVLSSDARLHVNQIHFLARRAVC